MSEENKEFEFRITGKSRLRPKLVIKIDGRLYNFGRLGAFERVVKAQKDGTPGYTKKVFVPTQEILEKYFNKGKQKLVEKIDVKAEKDFLAKQEKLEKDFKEQAQNSGLQTQESEKAEEIKVWGTKLKEFNAELDALNKNTKLSKEDKDLKIAQVNEKITAAKESIQNLGG